MPVTVPTEKEATAELDANSNEDYGSESDNAENSISVEVFVQEMHDSYTSYGKASVSLAPLLTTSNV